MSSIGTSAQRHCPSCGVSYPSDYAVCPMDATPLARGEPGDDPLVGTILGETYEIERRIADGGMGRVYAAKHVRLGRHFAVKVLHLMFTSDREAVTRFRREATAAASIVSPNVAQVFDVNATREGQPFLVYELIDGEDLGALLEREGALPIGRTIRIARQIAAGLRAAHEAGVVHRDLKPENVMLVREPDGADHVKVLDFGIAKISQEDKLTRTGSLLGTPAYMAPEQARGGIGLDHRCDIYALGAILYRALTGRPAFSGEDAGRTLTSVIWDEPARPKTLRRDLPEALELLVQRAMAKDPDARFPTMAELDAQLAPFDPPQSTTLQLPPRPPGDVGRAETIIAAPGAVASLPTPQVALARWARPRAVAFGVLSLVWCAVLAGSIIGLILTETTHHALGSVERFLVLALAAAFASPLAVWQIRRLLRGDWRNTATMLARADALGRATVMSMATYALLSAPGQLWALLHRESLATALELSALFIAAAVGAAVFFRRPS